MNAEINSGRDVRARSVISWWQDRLSSFVERRKSFFIFLGNLETWAVASEVAAIPIDKPIFICGLARAGSTILLEFLASQPGSATHQYRDFPFVYIPVWWNWFIARASRAEQNSIERFHKDRILINTESPEAMEEILWMAFFPTCHDSSQSNVLCANTRNPRFEEFYRDHIRKVLFVRGGSRYVAKGNYNVTRLQYLRELFPEARFVIPVRDPIDHVASLMRQHRIFCEEEQRDQRILAYMRRVGHFEFGLDVRPINVGNRDRTKRIERVWLAGEEVRGWARYWTLVYGFVADLLETDTKVRQATFLVHYGDLCGFPVETLARLYDHCEIDVAWEILHEQAARVTPPSYYSMPFSKDDVAVIEAETSKTHERIRDLCGLLG